MIGKVDPDSLREFVLGRAGTPDDRVLQGPSYGEDTAAIELDGGILVVNADPISMAVGRIGTLGVDVAANDVAASGADPEWLTSVVLLPGEEGALGPITDQLDGAARRLGIAIVGGHSEFAPALDSPMLVLTCFGLTDRYVPTGGAEPGDRVVLTKGAGIEATAILATDFRDRLEGRVSDTTLDAAEGFYDGVSVVPDAAVLRVYANAMHDPTEGGLVDGLLELAAASGVRLEIEREAIPVRRETRQLCEAMGVDPLRTFGSGSLLAAVPPESTDDALADLEGAGIDGAVVGTVEGSDRPALVLGGETFTEPVRDDMYALWE